MEAVSNVVYHLVEGNLNWVMIIYLSLAHVAAFIGLTILPNCYSYTMLWAYFMWPISMVGITAGSHR